MRLGFSRVNPNESLITNQIHFISQALALVFELGDIRSCKVCVWEGSSDVLTDQTSDRFIVVRCSKTTSWPG